MRIQPYDFTIQAGNVYEFKGANLIPTGIKATFKKIDGGATVMLQGYCLQGAEQFTMAVKEFGAAYPNSKLEFMSAAKASELGITTLGGLATSDVWLVVNGRAGVHPLMVRIRALKNTLRELDTELSQIGILAEIV